MRVELARALLGDFDVLLLDEPTNHLDLESAMWLQRHLASSPNTVVVVSHDACFLDAVCTDIIQVLHFSQQIYITFMTTKTSW